MREHCFVLPLVLSVPFKRRRKMSGRRRRRRGAGQFKRRRFKRRGSKLNQWGGTLKFATRFPGGNRVTQMPMPQTFFTKHAFYSTGTTNALDDFNLKTFIPSALFNVDSSGADAGFAADMNAFYKFYVVLGYSYRITYQNLTSTSSALFLVVPFSTNTSPPTSLINMEYRAGCKTAVLGVEQGGSAQKTLSGYVNTSSLFGTKLTEEEEFWGQDTNDPARPTFLYVVGQNMADSRDWDFSFRVHITMYVKWFNREIAGAPTVSFNATRAGHIASLKARVAMLDIEEEKVEGLDIVC